MQPIATDVWRAVCMHVRQAFAPCKNGWIYRDAVWHVEWGGALVTMY